MRLVSVGEVTLDHYLDLEQTFIGGISLNFAIHAKRSGAKHVSLISRVGSEDGQQILDKLERENIDTSHVAMQQGKTAAIDIEVLENGERIFPAGGYHTNVLTDFRLSSEELSFIQHHTILVTHFNSQPSSHFQQLKGLEFSGKRVVDFGDWSRRKTELDLVLRGLERLDIAFISGNEKTVEALLPYARERRLVVITLGAKGSAALVNGKVIRQASQKVLAPLDTTGCGDAFQGAFTVHYYRTGDLRGALERGAMRAARVLKSYGAS